MTVMVHRALLWVGRAIKWTIVGVLLVLAFLFALLHAITPYNGQCWIDFGEPGGYCIPEY